MAPNDDDRANKYSIHERQITFSYVRYISDPNVTLKGEALNLGLGHHRSACKLNQEDNMPCITTRPSGRNVERKFLPY